jgi:hypothetical protein
VNDKIKGKIEWVKSGDWKAGLALFFSSILFFYDIFTGRFLFTERDLGPYFIPPRFFWVESIKNWDFPLWDPYQFTGHPFFANPQHAILYPLNGLFFLLPFDWAFNAVIILHFFLGGFFTYLLLKDLKVHFTGSLIAGLIFMLSGYLLSIHSLLNSLLSVVWTPLIMMYFRRAFASPGLKNEMIAAVLTTISFLGGGLEIVYGNFLILLFMVFFLPSPDSPFPGGESRRVGSWERIWLGTRVLFAITIVFLLLSAIQLIPFLELYMHSIRGRGISYQEATIWSFAPKDVLLFFLPDAYGYFLDMKKYWTTQCWLKTLYAGGLPFLLSLVFFLFSRGRKLYLALLILSLFLSLGHYNPLYPLVFKYIPFFDGIRYPVKFLYIFILTLSITAGLGFEKLLSLAKEGRNTRKKHLLTLGALICGFFLLFLIFGHKEIGDFLQGHGIDSPLFNHPATNLYNAQRFFFYLVLFFLLLRVGHEVEWKRWAKVLLVFFLTADLFGNMAFFGKELTEEYFRKTRILEIISADSGSFRTFATGKTTSMDAPILIADATSLDILKEKHLPTIDLLYRVPNIWGIEVIGLKRGDDLYKAFTGAPSIAATNLIDLYGVKYVISVTPIEDTRYELIYARLEGLTGSREDLLKQNTVKLYKVHNPSPRFRLVKNYKVMDAAAILPAITRKDFDPPKEVFLEEEPQWEKESIPTPNSASGLSFPPNQAEIISESNNRMNVRVNITEDGLLVLSDTYFPGWKARVIPVGSTPAEEKIREREEKILRADYNFRALPLKAGTYEIRFRYDPFSFKLGGLISLLTGVGISGYLLKTRKSKGR